LKVSSAGSIALTEDGKKIAYVVTSIVSDEKNTDEYNYQTQIWIANSDGTGVPRQVTFSKEGASQPVWSPDGNTLAFVRPVDGNSQIFLLSLNGGEPLQLTTINKGASGPVWSPDGKQVAFVSSFSLREYVNVYLQPSGNVPLILWRNLV
jgi:dipeptidyl aminopeptidase/acylaminoacyl peptidase